MYRETNLGNDPSALTRSPVEVNNFFNGILFSGRLVKSPEKRSD
jgi:hypothetical protein